MREQSACRLMLMATVAAGIMIVASGGSAMADATLSCNVALRPTQDALDDFDTRVKRQSEDVVGVFQATYSQDIANFLASYIALETQFRTWANQLGDATGGLPVSVAPMKEAIEVARKALSDGFTIWPDESTALTSFKDIVRGRIIVADEAQLQKVLMTLADDTTITVFQFKNSWLKPKRSGFRDYTLILEFNAFRGRYAEFQVVARDLVIPVVEIAGIGKGDMNHMSHVLYEKVRMIFGDSKDSCNLDAGCKVVY